MPHLEFTGNKYIFHCTYQEHFPAKAAGFRWDPLEKLWWTADHGKASELAHHAPEEVKRRLLMVGEDLKETLELSRATDAAIEIPAPAGCSYLPYQKAGIAFAQKRPNVLIGDDMGLGKTIQAVGIGNLDESIETILVVCPASLRLNWQKELNKWLVRKRPIAIVGKKWPGRYFPVVIINYDILGKWHDELRETFWDLLIVDESQYLKNTDSLRTRMLLGCPAKRKRDPKTKQMVDHPGIVPVQARRIAMLTGTPIMNRPIELWPLIHALDPATWSNQFNFAKRYCNGHKSGRFWDFSGASHLEELQKKLRETIMIRRLKGDVLKELPPKRRQVIEIPANGHSDLVAQENSAWDSQAPRRVSLQAAVELAKASDDVQVYREAVRKLKEGISAGLTEIARLRHMTALAKLPDVIEHLHSCLESDGKLVVFAHHVDVLQGLEDAFNAPKGYAPPPVGEETAKQYNDRRAREAHRWPQNVKGAAVAMYGVHSMEERQAAVERFQKDPACKVIIGGLGPMGVGHTLTASSHVVFAEIDWVPAVISQAEDRTHRIGQRNSVLAQHLVLEGSLDARMLNRIVAKQEVIDAALDSDSPIPPEEDEPIATADKGEEAATQGVRREQIAREAEKLTPEQIAATHRALQLIAGVCDGANAQDGHGFSKIDAFIGHDLAHAPRLSPKQAALGRRIALKYRRQLDDDLIAVIQGV